MDENTFWITCKCGGESESSSNIESDWLDIVCPDCKRWGCWTLAEDQCPECGSELCNANDAYGVTIGSRCTICEWSDV